MLPPSSFATFGFDTGLLEINNNLDFSTLFDDTEMDFFHTEDDAPVVTPRQTFSEVTTTEVSPPQALVTPPASVSSHASSPVPQQSFVNIVMIVDPNTQKVICPKQELTYDLNGKTEKVVFGPTVLDAMPQDLMNLISLATHQQQTQQTPESMSETVPPVPQSSGVLPPFPTLSNEVIPSPSSMPSISESNHVNHNSGLLAFGDTSASGMMSSSLGDSYISEDLNNNNNGAPPPLRALSAYNFFFRDERDRILHGGDYEWTPEKQRELLAAHWNQDRTKKRRHRKSHGKIDFTTLSRRISSRWKELPEHQKEFYRQVAAQDWERYQRELEDYKSKPTIGGSGGNFASAAMNPLMSHFPTVIG